ncbi:LCP family protein [Actinotalea subterranea]|uniref:LCP family protein n=1 Tax=Actinotalea subterranea TaxID=2607497 RepID=UPI0011EE0630|nr:LCP family protein [Actinotalea subterranea]
MPVDQAARHARTRNRRPRHLREVALTLTAVLAFGGSAAAFTVARWHGNVTSVGSIDDLVVPASAPGSSASPTPVTADDALAGRAVTILLLGSDDRSGENGEIGGTVDGMRADTTMIVHVSADRTRVEVASIPRDSKASIPACHLDWDPEGRMSRPQTAKFNAAFATGAGGGDVGLGAACAISTVQTMTGLTVDAFALVDFAGFQGMVDAIGGVRVCVPEPLKDGRYTALNLSAGWHDLQGAEALDYVRARHVQGTDGTDPSRIERQQRFVGAVVRKVTSSDVLTSPLALGGFLDAATSALTVSEELSSPATLLGLIWSVRDLRPADVTFVTVPWAYGANGYVTWTSDADLLWQRLAADEPVNGTPPPPADPVADPTAGAGQTTPPATGTAPPATGTTPPATGTPDAGTPATGTEGAPVTPPEPDFVVQTGEDPDEVLCG